MNSIAVFSDLSIEELENINGGGWGSALIGAAGGAATGAGVGTYFGAPAGAGICGFIGGALGFWYGW